MLGPVVPVGVVGLELGQTGQKEQVLLLVVEQASRFLVLAAEVEWEAGVEGFPGWLGQKVRFGDRELMRKDRS